MPLILPANTLSTGGYDVANSCRFNRASSESLERTPGSAGNRRTFTFSCWFKLGNLASSQSDYYQIFGGFNGTGNDGLWISNSDKLYIYLDSGERRITNQVIRDPSAWYNAVLAIDTTQGTAANRIKLYLNGSEITSFSTNSDPTLNYDSGVNDTSLQNIGERVNDDYLDGYIAEAVLIDGQQLTPTSFGEFDEDSPTIWKPIDVSGLTFGTNGFYLDFEDSSALGNDVSGNDNDFTVNNLAATDQSQDSPTNNFCTINPLDQAVGTFDISEGNLKYERTSDTTNWKCARGTIGIPNAGKWYWEMAKVGGSVDGGFGGIATDVADLTQEVTGFWGFHDGPSGSNYTIYNTGYTDVGSSYNISDGDIIQIAFDRDNNKLWVGRNNTWGVNGGTPVTPSDPASGFLSISTNVLPAFMIAGTSQNVANFGQDSSFAGNITRQSNSDGNGYGDFYYTPPSGYLALCTKNLGSDGG